MKKTKRLRLPKAATAFPSQNALQYVSHQLQSMRHRAEKDAIVFERAGNKENEDFALSLRLQADDMRQVAVFLEGWILEPTKTRCKGRKCK